MKSVNIVHLMGFLGSDPKIVTFPNGGSIANLSLATESSFKDKNGQKQTITEWHNLVLNGGLVDIASKYLKKGMAIHIVGYLRYKKYTDKNSNVEKIKSEIVVRDLSMLPGAKNKDSNCDDHQPQNNNNEDDGLPF